MRTYVQDQWLRNWFLGGGDTIDYSAGPQLDHGGQQAFATSLGKVWKNIANSAESSDSLHMYVRFGVIPSALVDAKTLQSLAGRVRDRLVLGVYALGENSRCRQAASRSNEGRICRRRRIRFPRRKSLIAVTATGGNATSLVSMLIPM